jgi:uncharacterized membrane protein YheB (UPF0754 family)
MNNWLFILIPVFTAFAGWLSVRLLFKMLFHPREPRNILGFKLQGIYPKHRYRIAHELGNYISQGDLFNSIEQKINDPDNLEKIMPLIENHIDDFLRNRLGKEMPMISMFIGDKTIAKLKEAFLKEIQSLFPDVMKAYATGLRRDINPVELVEKQMAAMTPAKLEAGFTRSLYKELRLAAMMGALIGLIIGLLQLALVLLVVNN